LALANASSELDTMFISKPIDRELTVTGQSLKSAWEKINQKLWKGLRILAVGIGRAAHAVSEKSSKREPNRNKFTVLLGDSAHVIYVGQAMLAGRSVAIARAAYICLRITEGGIMYQALKTQVNRTLENGEKPSEYGSGSELGGNPDETGD